MKRHRALPWLLIGGLIAVALALNWPVANTGPSERVTSQNLPFNARRMRRRRPIWRPVAQQERQAAINSIVAQLKACKRGDFKRAAWYQSKLMKRRLNSPDAFRRMIQHYPQFAHYKSVRFGRSRADARGRFLQIEVDLTGMDNVRARAVYFMVLENKMYRVGGVEGGHPEKERQKTPEPESATKQA